MDERDDRPNLVVVVADDLGIGDVGVYGSPLIATPVMDRLAASGLRCEAMYAAASTDTPSRAGMLVGRYGARYGLPGSSTPDTPGGLPADAVTIASALREAGYATGYVGQWRLGAGDGQHPLDHGFDHFSGTLYGPDVAPQPWYEGRAVADETVDPATLMRRITASANDVVSGIRAREDTTGRRTPYLLVVSHLAPHLPHAAEPQFFGRSAAGLYGDVVEQFDHYLGTLRRQLLFRHGGDDTLLMVTSDNGPRYEGRTRARRGRKPELFDGGVLVPFVASWLRGRRPVVDEVPRSLLDLTPTLCALAGVAPPADLDGEDFSPLLTGGSVAERGPVFLFYNEYLHAMRTGMWKFHRGYGAGQSSYMPQLFDLDGDFRENYSVANLHPDLVETFGTRLEQLGADVANEAAAREERA